MRGQHQSQAGVIRESLSDESDVETRYEFAAYTICGAVSTRRGEIEGLPHNTLSKPLQRSKTRLYFGCAKAVPSAEVETADLETTLGIFTNGDNGRRVSVQP